MAPPLSIEHLRQQLQLRASTEAIRFAADLLAQTDLTPMQLSGAMSPASHFLPIYRTRLKMKLEGITGLEESGLSDFVQRMTELPPDTLLGITAFETPQWMLLFWSNDADGLVGTVIVKRRTAEEEAQRLREFQRDLT